MTFVTSQGSREFSQGLTQGAYQEDSTFNETFGASVGLIFDEGLSISSSLNRESYVQRSDIVKQTASEGQIDLTKYQKNSGAFDYDAFSADNPDSNVRTDRQLYEERNEYLRKKREYGQGVIDRGSGLASITGNLAGYLLDPVNIVTLPLGGASASVKGLGALATAANVGKNEALIALASELAIQPLVYSHKQDINSPYSINDSLEAIGTAALGGFLIGGITGGISGYFGKVKSDLDGKLTDSDSIDALNNIARLKDDLDYLKAERPVDLEASSKAVITGRIDELTEIKFGRISDNERVALSKKLSDSGASRKTINETKAILDADDLARKAESEINDINKGKYTDELELSIGRAKAELEIESDKYLIQRSEQVREEFNSRSSEVEVIQGKPRVKSQTATQRQREVLSRRGLESNYDADIEAYNALDNPKIVVDDQITDAGEFFKDIDNDIAGLDEVLRCAIG